MAKKVSKKAQKKERPTLKRQPRLTEPKSCKRDPCLDAYGHALANGFSPQAKGACIPDGKGGATVKITTVLKAPVTAPADGSKGLLLLIRPTASNDRHDMQKFWESDSTLINDISAAGEFLTSVGSPYATSDFGTGRLEQRLVSCDVRVTNTGPPLTTSGIAYTYGLMNPTYINGADGPNVYKPQGATRYRTMKQMLDKPLEAKLSLDDFTNYSEWRATDKIYDIDGSYAGTAQRSVGFIYLPHNPVDGVSAFVEMVCHWELRGRTVTPYGIGNPNPQPAVAEGAYGKLVGAIRAAGNAVPDARTLKNMFDIYAYATQRVQPALTYPRTVTYVD